MVSEHGQNAAGRTGDTERFTWLERPGDDFPYYNGQPVGLDSGQWWRLLAAVALGFLSLVYIPSLLPGELGQYSAAILFFAIPLLALARFSGRHWTALFRRLQRRDWLWMLLFALLNLVVALLVGWLVKTTLGTSDNPVFARLAEQPVRERVLFFLRTIPQLFGEEVLTIIPFLALLHWLYARLGWSRRKAIVVAWIGSALLFGAAHLPTYDWNLVQSLGVIGSARLVLLLPYLMTKNIWVSTGAHIVNDWLMFAAVLGTGAASTGQ